MFCFVGSDGEIVSSEQGGEDLSILLEIIRGKDPGQTGERRHSLWMRYRSAVRDPGDSEENTTERSPSKPRAACRQGTNPQFPDYTSRSLSYKNSDTTLFPRLRMN
jgi:hypothetical protein